jgi:hypothetical protein
MAGCSEVYRPDDIETVEPIPVIQGIIMQGESPRVRLSWTHAKDEGTEYISGAHVRVSDDWSNVAELEDYGGGLYTRYDTSMLGTIGKNYTLIVELPDGRIYFSSPQYMEKPPSFDSLYADPGLTELYTYNANGDPIFENAEGLEILADLSDYVNKPFYYRFNTTSVKMMVRTVDMGSPASHSVYMWETRTIDDTYSVDNTVGNGFKQLLLRHNVGFLRYFYDVTLETPTSTAPFTEAWALTFNIYSISRDVFEYYNSIARQLGSEDQIFAPIASQVKSNMTCISDPSQKAAGVFEACSKTTVYKAFGWKTLTEYKSKNLDYFPEGLGNGEQLYWPPYFWVYF